MVPGLLVETHSAYWSISHDNDIRIQYYCYPSTSVHKSWLHIPAIKSIFENKFFKKQIVLWGIEWHHECTSGPLNISRAFNRNKDIRIESMGTSVLPAGNWKRRAQGFDVLGSVMVPALHVHILSSPAVEFVPVCGHRHLLLKCRELAAARPCICVASVTDDCLLQDPSYRSETNLLPKELILCHKSLT